jgi:acyl-CoA synthetase (AMP-forming)/AMP-acid ligase II
MASFDVTSFGNRRATARHNRVALGDMLERLTWSFPDKEAIIGWEGAYAHAEHARLTYRQADRIANQFGNALLEAGCSGKDRVLMLCENSVEAYLTKLGIAKAGLVIAPMNPSLAPDVIAHLIKKVEPKLVVVDAEVWPRVQKAFAETGVKPAVTIGIGGDTIPGTKSWRDFIASAPNTEPDVEIHGDDIAELQFTSGTTAMPKAVMLSHSNANFSAYGYALSLTRGLKCENDLRLCSFLPLIYHIGGQIFGLSVLLAGGTLVIGRKPVADQVVRAVTQERITMLWGGSPVMINAFLEAAQKSGGDITSLTLVMYGWAAITPATYASLRELAGQELIVCEIFGQTETIACHRFWPHEHMDLFGKACPENNYVGLPSPLLASHVMAPDGSSLEGQPRVVGEAVYRSPTVMQGYYKDEEATKKAFEFGWFHSGDSCIYDEQGLRIMVDRSKDIVKSGGENVSSLRVEAVIVQHPGVLRVAIIGLADERWGEAVTAVVMRRPEVPPVDEPALIAWSRERLGGFETPKRVIFVESYPETVGGKIMKHVLRAELGKR